MLRHDWPRDSAARQLLLALRSADRDGDGCVTALPAAEFPRKLVMLSQS